MVTDSFHPLVGGSETAIKNLSLGFIKAGHQVRVYGLFEGVKSPDPRLEVIHIPPKFLGKNLRLFGRYFNLDREIKKYRPDIINAHFMLQSGWAGVKVAKKYKIASVVTVRGRGVFYIDNTWFKKIKFTSYRKMSLKADRMIATSAEMADMVDKRWGRRPTPLSNGVDVNLFKPGIHTDLKQKLGLSNNKIILCVRRLVPKNGIEYMVRALPQILSKDPSTRLILVAPKLREYETLVNIAKELKILDKIIFPGEVGHEELPNYFAIADVVVQPSIAEARSLSCLEAMAAGSALIVTKTGGLAELVDHQRNGYVIPAFEESTYQVGPVHQRGVDNLAQAVLTVMTDDSLRHTIKKGARQTALENSWDIICNKTLDIYQDAIIRNKANK